MPDALDGNGSDIRPRYDVVVAGARVAGAATAMLLARAGLEVLVVDPGRRGSDTLSTHALMRAGVLQLHRWGLLERVRAAGTPRIESTTFVYGDDAVTVPIRAKHGVDGLYAPRRTVLDALLVDAAREAGAHVVHGVALIDVVRDLRGRVEGAVVGDRQTREWRVSAELVIGADGLRSRVARLVDAQPTSTAPHATASIYGYVPGLGISENRWYYRPGAAIGAIPTNGGDTCVFASLPPTRFHAQRDRGLDVLFQEVIREVSPELANALAAVPAPSRLRAFPGVPSTLRRSQGPGWALVGDAGYFKDPLTAHGISDALRDAELLARAAVAGGRAAFEAYEAARDALALRFMGVTDRIASFDWTLDEVRALHHALSREMKSEVEVILGWTSRIGGELPSRRWG